MGGWMMRFRLQVKAKTLMTILFNQKYRKDIAFAGIKATTAEGVQ